VSLFVNVTEAPSITAPEESTTVPFSDPVDIWAWAVKAARNNKRGIVPHTLSHALPSVHGVLPDITVRLLQLCRDTWTRNKALITWPIRPNDALFI
jgi:hypothetical protein